MDTGHDLLSTKIHEDITNKLSNREGNWVKMESVFSRSLSRVGAWDWPRPDYVIQDDKNYSLIASEFKPPGWDKREYITGLGQCISYLERHHYSMLVIPDKANDGFLIGDYIRQILSLDILKNVPTCLVVYDAKKIAEDLPNSISLILPITSKRGAPPKAASTTPRTYWAFWRDISNHEVFRMLELSDKYNCKPGDIYTDYVFKEFFYELCNGLTKDWEGKPRKKRSTSKSQEKQNNKIPLFHVGLWDQSEGRLTLDGYRMLNIGKRYGAASPQFLDYLTQLLLLEGKHLDLIQHIQNFQDSEFKNLSGISSKDFKKRIDGYLEKKNLIGKRKPGRVTTGAKETFIRDEFKVWNKLGLLKCNSPTQYFYSGRGLLFRWDRITEVLRTDFSRL